MQFWNRVIDTALIGTEKRSLLKEDVPLAIADVLNGDGLDKEEVFLQMATAIANYKRCGFKAPVQNIGWQPAPAEALPYCGNAAVQVLKEILSLSSKRLLLLWLAYCEQKQSLVTPELIPTVLDIAGQFKVDKSLVSAVVGSRGKWLAQWNESWSAFYQTNADNIWETGSLAERCKWLQSLRTIEPAAARDLIQQVWNKENAAAKTELLKSMAIGLCVDDLPWLETLLQEKSQKVKEEAMQLLKQLPASSIVQLYETTLSTAMEIKKSNGFLGIGNKTDILFSAVVNQAVFQTGITPLSNTKEIEDDVFVVSQLIAHVPLSFWQKHFNTTLESILAALDKTKYAVLLKEALMLAAIRFKDQASLVVIVNKTENVYLPEALPLLPVHERETYALYCIRNGVQEYAVVERLCSIGEPLGKELTGALLRFTALDMYRYNKAFYAEIALLLNPAGLYAVQDLTLQQAYLQDAWIRNYEYLIHLQHLQQLTIQSFS